MYGLTDISFCTKLYYITGVLILYLHTVDGVDSVCVDLNPECAVYGFEKICYGGYRPWSTIYCRKFCNFCVPAATTVTTTRSRTSYPIMTKLTKPDSATTQSLAQISTYQVATQFSTTTPGTVKQTANARLNVCSAQVKQRVLPQHLYQFGEKCYEFVPSKDSWFHAREDCHGKGGHLLSIESAEEQAFVFNMLNEMLFTQQVWLGLNDRVNEEKWNWDSGNSLNYTNWSPGRYIDRYHDEEDCAIMVMIRRGMWDDVECNGVEFGAVLSYPWICEYNRQKPVLNSSPAIAASWSSWFNGVCSVTCGTGTAGRLRRCSTGHEPDCSGKAFEMVPCDAGPCPVDGSWSLWQQWTTCSVTCGDGRRIRTRNCDNPAPQYGGANCSGSKNETSSCNVTDCPHWLPFYQTSYCSVTCGVGFIQLKRNCSSGKPSDCLGSEYSEKSCNLMSCS